MRAVLRRARLAVLRATTIMCLLIAAGNVAGSVAGGAGMNLVAGLAWCALWLLAACLPEVTAAWLSRWRITTALLALANAGTVALTGGVDSTDLAVCLYVGWIASVVVAAPAALAMSTAISGSIVVGYLLAGASPAEILTGPDRYNLVLSALLPLLAGIVGALLATVTNSVFDDLPDTLFGLRHGGSASTPAMTALLAGRPVRALPPATPSVQDHTSGASDTLTNAEREVVDLLADGYRPKQIALMRGVALSTVRSQIRAAKRKTGAATIDELIARAWSTEA